MSGKKSKLTTTVDHLKGQYKEKIEGGIIVGFGRTNFYFCLTF
jgi:hypothetical protein